MSVDYQLYVCWYLVDEDECWLPAVCMLVPCWRGWVLITSCMYVGTLLTRMSVDYQLYVCWYLVDEDECWLPAVCMLVPCWRGWVLITSCMYVGTLLTRMSVDYQLYVCWYLVDEDECWLPAVCMLVPSWRGWVLITSKSLEIRPMTYRPSGQVAETWELLIKSSPWTTLMEWISCVNRVL